MSGQSNDPNLEFQREMETWREENRRAAELWRAQFDRDMEILREQNRLNFEYWKTQQVSVQGAFRAVIEYSIIAIRGIVLINGGAAVSILAFLGHILGSNKDVSNVVVSTSLQALSWFVYGTGAGVLCAGLAYVTQTVFAEYSLSHPKLAEILGSFLRFVTIGIAGAGLFLFWLGADAGREAFIKVSQMP